MRYVIGGLVGSGSFGRVHEAFDRAGSRFAVKVVDAGDGAALRLLRAQYRILSAADHRRVVRVYDLVEDEGEEPYLVMEFVEGRSLVRCAREEGLSALPGLTAQVLDALRHIHSLGAVHADLKPDSILVRRLAGGPVETTGRADAGGPREGQDPAGTRYGRSAQDPEGERGGSRSGGPNLPAGLSRAAGLGVTLVDVGFDPSSEDNLPTLRGTLPYMAPEVIRSARADARSDLYSLGVVLFEALTGACPFGGAVPEEIMSRHLDYSPPPPSVVSADVDPRWDGLVSRLLSKEPTRRYPGALQAALALGEAFGQTEMITRALSPPRTLVHLWEAQADGAEEALKQGPGRALVVRGSPGCGAASVLRSLGARLKSRGTRVITVSMESGLPLSSQVIQSLAGRFAEGSVSGGGAPPHTSDSRLFSLDSIMEAYGLEPGRRRHALLVEGGRNVDCAALEEMARLAASNEGFLDVVIGTEGGAGLPEGAAPAGSTGAIAEQRPGKAGVPAGAGPASGVSGAPRLEVMHLQALMREGMTETLRRHFGVTAMPSDLLEALVGNVREDAVLLEETLAELWNRGDIRYRSRGDGLELEWTRRAAIPESLRQVVESRVAGLGECALHAAGLMALAGGTLEREALLGEMGGPEGLGAIESLSETELITDTGEPACLRFRHADTRDIVMERIPADRGRPAALSLARTVEGLSTGPEASYRIGSLYFEGGAPAEALSHFMRAGEHSARFSITDALHAYGRALECRPSPEQRARLEERMGDLKVVESDFEAARGLFERASVLSPAARRKLGWVEALKGGYESAESILEECRRVAVKRCDRAEEARVGLDLAYVYAARGRIEESLNTVRKARRFFEGEDMPLDAGMAAYREGISHMRAGAYRRAAAAWEEGIPFFEKAGEMRLVAQSLQAIGYASRKELDYPRAERSLKRSLEMWSDLRGLSQRGATSNTYAFVLLETGDLRGAMEYAVEALEFNAMAGHHPGVMLARVLMAAIELDIGNWRSAERLLGQVQPDIPAEDLYLKAQVQRYSAVARTIAGDREGAMSLLRDSHSSARLAGDEEGKHQALLEKAAALLRFGQAEEAADAARDALVGFSVESSLLFAARAQALLGEALCLSGSVDEGFEKLAAARENLMPVMTSQYMGRALAGLARASYMRRDHATFVKHLDEALAVMRGAEARYDYAEALHLGGLEALERGAFLRARNYLAEAARIFDSLEIEDLKGKVVRTMESIPAGEGEAGAVNSLSRISEALLSSRDLDGVLNTAVDMAMEYLGADRGVLMLAADRTGELATVVERKMDEESLREVMDISRSIVESVRATGRAVIATDPGSDPRFKDSNSIRAHNIMSVMCLPLMRAGRLLGLIYLDTRVAPAAFTGLERSFVEAFANQVALAVENARAMGELRSGFEDLKVRAGERYDYSNIVGPGPRMQEVFRQVEKAARTDTSILLTGESGTGKDIVAGLIHRLSPRRDAPFVEVNCPGIAKDLVESELFGIEKSVATGVAPRSGYFERADGGTIFLNEIGDVPLATQVRVLRVIEDRVFERVGGSRVIKVDLRVISATNQDLRALIAEGMFRKDLYFRLNHIQIQLPPLRERMEDLPDLIDHFVRKYAAKNSKPVRRVSPDALDALRSYRWPGNVRELERCIERAVVFAEGEVIGREHLTEDVLAGGGRPDVGVAVRPDKLSRMVEEFERLQILSALEEAGWNKSRAARALGMHESTIRKKMKQYGIAKSPD